MGKKKSAESYRRTVRELSERIVESQRQIRILDAVKWDDGVREAFFRSRCKTLPPVGPAYYRDRPLPFEPDEKKRELYQIERDIRRLLGQFNPVGEIMQRMCREYRQVVRMLEHRGEPEFSEISRELYGSSSDAFHAGDPSLADLAVLLSEVLAQLDHEPSLAEEPKGLSGEEAVAVLQERLAAYFEAAPRDVRVKVSDGIVADAAAGADYVKLRRESRFNHRDLRLLEIHEGWVHIGTTLNGQAQPVCTFLAKGPPSSTATQEGLAILTEILSFASHPGRVRRLTNRILGVQMAEEGADFLEVFRFFRDQGMSPEEGFAHAHRVFRGSTPDGGPFTKDLVYSKGFVLIYNYLVLAVRRGLTGRIPLLFCGKTTLEDQRTLAHLVEEGIVVPPRFVPPPFQDLRALAAWMAYSNFLSRLDPERIEADYAGIL
jgi:uncharacterized protein (TIGR02421 family)